jgi:hypothetical protein
MSWYGINKLGLRRMTNSLSTLVWEMLQNAVDTDATEIDLRIEPLVIKGVTQRSRTVLAITDNDPRGYEDLTHSYEMFAPSTKAGDSSKRGFMNIGEKLVLAWAVEGVVETMSGSVKFHDDGETRTTSRRRTEIGSYHRFVLDVPATERDKMVAAARRILVPVGKTVRVNGEVLQASPVLDSTKATLNQLVLEGNEMVQRPRLTRITLHEPDVEHGAWLYVLGMPVQAIDIRWSVNVEGRLKQDVKRDQVPEGQLQKIRVAVTDLMVDTLTVADANTWGRAALKDVAPVTARKLVELRHGVDAVAYDAHDREANARAQANDRTVIYGGAYSSEEWAAIKRVRVEDPTFVAPAGQLFNTLPTSVPAVLVPRSEWTDDAVRVVEYAEKAYRHLFDKTLSVSIAANRDVTCCATMGGRTLTFAVNKLPGKWDWFKPGNEAAQVSLLLHEFGHSGRECHNHNEVWANHALDLAGRLLTWGVLP